MEILRNLDNRFRDPRQRVEPPVVQEALEPTYPSPGKYLVKNITTHYQNTQDGREMAGYEFKIIGHGNDGTPYYGTVIQREFMYKPNFDSLVDRQNPLRDPTLIIGEPGKISTLVAPDGRITVDESLYENNSPGLIMPYQSHGLTDGPSSTRVYR